MRPRRTRPAQDLFHLFSAALSCAPTCNISLERYDEWRFRALPSAAWGAIPRLCANAKAPIWQFYMYAYFASLRKVLVLSEVSRIK